MMQRMVAAIAITTLILGGAERAKAGLVFFDGTFNDADWTVPVSHDFVGAGQVASGGNPGSYRLTRISFNEQFDFAANLNGNFLYAPSAQGAITGLTFASDLMTPNLFGGSYFALARQAGVFYYDPSEPENASGNLWLHNSRTLGLGDFTRLDGAPGSPDFTSTGAAIEFGYLVIVAGAGFFESDTGIDNYSLTVSATAVPEPSSILSLVLGLAGLTLSYGMRRRSKPARVSGWGLEAICLH